MKKPLIRYGQLKVKMYRDTFDRLNNFYYKYGSNNYTQHMEMKAGMIRCLHRRKKK